MQCDKTTWRLSLGFHRVFRCLHLIPKKEAHFHGHSTVVQPSIINNATPFNFSLLWVHLVANLRVFLKLHYGKQTEKKFTINVIYCRYFSFSWRLICSVFPLCCGSTMQNKLQLMKYILMNYKVLIATMFSNICLNLNIQQDFSFFSIRQMQYSLLFQSRFGPPTPGHKTDSFHHSFVYFGSLLFHTERCKMQCVWFMWACAAVRTVRGVGGWSQWEPLGLNHTDQQTKTMSWEQLEVEARDRVRCWFPVGPAVLSLYCAGSHLSQ